MRDAEHKVQAEYTISTGRRSGRLNQVIQPPGYNITESFPVLIREGHGDTRWVAYLKQFEDIKGYGQSPDEAMISVTQSLIDRVSEYRDWKMKNITPNSKKAQSQILLGRVI